VSPPNWGLLLVTVNDRAAIFSEEFPARIAAAGSDVGLWFSHAQAHDLLYTFAGAWPTLGRDPYDPAVRYVHLSDGEFVCRFRAIELRSSAIVVDDVFRLRHDS
jgi:hypothetical protein